MAKNWNVYEAIEKICQNDVESILDFGKRFPVFTANASKAVSGDVEAMVRLFGAMPENLTVGKIEKVLKGACAESVEAEESAEVEENAEETEVKPEPKKRGGKPKAVKKAEETEENAYSNMSAKEAYNECKNRGILVETRKDKEYYVSKLIESDNAKAEDDSWDDEEEETVKPEPKKRGRKPKAEAKTEPVEEVEEEFDDDDWDI